MGVHDLSLESEAGAAKLERADHPRSEDGHERQNQREADNDPFAFDRRVAKDDHAQDGHQVRDARGPNEAVGVVGHARDRNASRGRIGGAREDRL